MSQSRSRQCPHKSNQDTLNKLSALPDIKSAYLSEKYDQHGYLVIRRAEMNCHKELKQMLEAMPEIQSVFYSEYPPFGNITLFTSAFVLPAFILFASSLLPQPMRDFVVTCISFGVLPWALTLVCLQWHFNSKAGFIALD